MGLRPLCVHEKTQDWPTPSSRFMPIFGRRPPAEARMACCEHTFRLAAFKSVYIKLFWLTWTLGMQFTGQQCGPFWSRRARAACSVTLQSGVSLGWHQRVHSKDTAPSKLPGTGTHPSHTINFAWYMQEQYTHTPETLSICKSHFKHMHCSCNAFLVYHRKALQILGLSAKKS